MKILLLAPIHNENAFSEQKKLELKKFGQVVNPFPVFQGHNSWFMALSKLGHKMEIIYYTQSILWPNLLRVKLQNIFIQYLPIWYARFLRIRSKLYFLSFDNYLRNLNILRQILLIHPDLIVISGGTTVIFPLTLKLIKKKINCTIFLLNGMDPLTRSTITERKMVKIIDVFFTNDPLHSESWLKMGAKKAVCLPISSLEPQIYKKYDLTKEEISKYSCDICFVGTITEERQKLLLELNDFNLKIWGEVDLSLKMSDQLKALYQGKAKGEEMAKIFNCAKIVLNIHDSSMKRGGNLRTFEICGCNAFQLADRVPKEWFIDGKELVLFKDKKDLKEKITFYLKNEKKRKEIAKSGFERALADHTYEKHFTKMLSFVYQPKEFWENWGRTFIDDAYQRGIYDQHQWFLDKIKEIKPKNILEFGCGFGRNIKFLIDNRIPANSIIGVDISGSMLEKAKKYLQNSGVKLIEVDGQNLPFKDKSFDLTLVHGVYMHVKPENIFNTIKETLRVTEKYLICIEQNYNGNPYTFVHEYREIFKKLKAKIVEEKKDKKGLDLFLLRVN